MPDLEALLNALGGKKDQLGVRHQTEVSDGDTCWTNRGKENFGTIGVDQVFLTSRTCIKKM